MSNNTFYGPLGGIPGTSMASWALGYAAVGWLVLPLYEITEDARCACGDAACSSGGKHPRTPRGFNDASCEPETIAGWWGDWRQANLGVRTGCGFIVLDVDGPVGEQSLAALEAALGPLPSTLTQRSGQTGGRHLFFRVPGDVRIPRWLGARPKLDLIADGSYIVVAPSNHKNGHRYAWVNSLAVADLPSRWVSAFRATITDAPITHLPTDRGHATSVQLLEWLPAKIEAPRRPQFVRLAGWLRGQGLEREEIFHALMDINRTRCVEPVQEKWIQRAARWVSRKPERGDASAAEVVREFALWIEGFEFRGSQGPRRRRIAMAVLEILKMTGKRVVALSVRDIALRAAPCSPSSASKGLKWLHDQGAIRRVSPRPRHGLAYQYEITASKIENTLFSSASQSVRVFENLPATDARAGLFRRGVLGESAQAVFEHLRPDLGRSVGWLKAATGLSAPTIREALRRLGKCNLAVADGREYRRGHADLMAVATHLEVADWAQANRDRIVAEQQEYHSAENQGQRRRMGREKRRAQSELRALLEEHGFPECDVRDHGQWRRLSDREGWIEWLGRASRTNLLRVLPTVRQTKRSERFKADAKFRLVLAGCSKREKNSPATFESYSQNRVTTVAKGCPSYRGSGRRSHYCVRNASVDFGCCAKEL